MEPQKIKTGARDFFLHFGAMVALYAGTVALINLLFRIINVAYPQVDQYFLGTTQVSLPVATLIVVFPIFLILTNIVRKGYEAEAERKQIAIRKWLVYITLFITGAVISGDLITLIYFFLDGRELTPGFLLKFLAVLVVTGSIFGYYLEDLRDRLTSTKRNYWRLVAGVLVVGSIVAGFTVIGSPRAQRLARYDEQKVNDLQNIQSQVITYWQQKNKLPTALDELKDPLSYFSIPLDSQTGSTYEYKNINPLTFELCAVFNKKSGEVNTKPRMSNAYYYVGMENENWVHGEGRSCFTRTVDPDRYPPFMKGL